MKILILKTTLVAGIFLSFCDSNVTAQIKGTQWTLKESKVSYRVNYTFKTISGSAVNSKGKGLCVEGKCDFLIAVPVKDFDSEDSNRDARMLEVTKALLHPLITFKLTTHSSVEKDFSADVEINFSGNTKKYDDVKFQVKSYEDKYVVSSEFNIHLEDFSIERPKLLGIAIENQVPIQIVSTWTK